MNVDSLNYSLALGTVVMQTLTVILLVAYFSRERISFFAGIGASVERWGLWAGFLVSLAGVVLSLTYSDVLGFEPCYWCYWQRIFLYPQVVLLGMAAWKKDAYMADYSIVLSVFGAAVALYHHAMQTLGEGSLPCPATGGVSCAKRIIFEFGYVTFPMMAFAVFAFLIMLMLFVRLRRAA